MIAFKVWSFPVIILMFISYIFKVIYRFLYGSSHVILFVSCSSPVEIIDIVLYNKRMNCILGGQMHCVLIHIVHFGAGTPNSSFPYSFIPEVTT